MDFLPLGRQDSAGACTAANRSSDKCTFTAAG
jgi:hypothetical protein